MSYHAQVELKKVPMFAVRHRANYYGAVALKLDDAYAALIDHGMDAVFTVKFVKKEKPAP